MKITIGFLTVSVSWKNRTHRKIEAVFRNHHLARQHWGWIYQDWHEHRDGEVFYDNLSLKEYEALPLKSKRLGNAARNYHGELYDKTRIGRQLIGDTGCFAVFVQMIELESLTIKYVWP